MESELSSAEYRQRAEMHESLASATADAEARKIHRAMAETYRRKAEQQESEAGVTHGWHLPQFTGLAPVSRDMISEPSARTTFTTIAVGAPLAAGLTMAVISWPTLSVFRL